jgi:hypothetical protein
VPGKRLTKVKRLNKRGCRPAMVMCQRRRHAVYQCAASLKSQPYAGARNAHNVVQWSVSSGGALRLASNDLQIKPMEKGLERFAVGYACPSAGWPPVRLRDAHSVRSHHCTPLVQRGRGDLPGGRSARWWPSQGDLTIDNNDITAHSRPGPVGSRSRYQPCALQAQLCDAV